MYVMKWQIVQENFGVKLTKNGTLIAKITSR